MTPDRRSRVLRTALQAAVPAALLLVTNLTGVLPSLLDGSALIVVSAVLTTLASLLQNLRDGRGDPAPDA